VALLEVRNLTVEFATDDGIVHAVTDVSYDLAEGETLGVVGESGSGKSAHVLAMLDLLPRPPARIRSGRVLFGGRDLLGLDAAEMRGVRGREIGFVFQNPMTSLHPMLTIGRQIGEVLEQHLHLSGAQARTRTIDLLRLVHIPDPEKRINQYPHEFSGGMRQRVMIAIALACEPRLLIADEPTTALDVTIQAQILDLIRGLQKRLNMSLLLITHDLGVVAGIADTVQVMYGGRILERGPIESVFNDPRNAYTWGLLQSLPREDDRDGHRLRQIDGAPPDMRVPPPGDPFAPRNPYATERCHREMPPLIPVPDGAPGHLAAAWYDLRAARRQEAVT
jgi:peptide/nickel transport system ATP-binding protein/oligopeptide transport system ATP-binding protein